MACGILIAVLSLMISNNTAMAIMMGVMLTVMVVVPIVFSYTEFQKEKKMVKE